MSQDLSKTYLLIGTVTKDIQPDGSFTPGGTVNYASTVALKLGWRPVIITRAASDFIPPQHLREIQWCILPSSETTTFRNDYYPEGRIQTIGPIAGPITLTDIPESCQQGTIIHLCPLAQDVEPEVTTVLSPKLLGATPQGWLRQWDEKGIVSLGQWHKMEEVLPHLQAAVMSIEDVEHNWDIAKQWASQIPVLVVTHGESGCTIFHNNTTEQVPARPANPVDLTGAGDVFAAAFFIRFFETDDLWQAARFANVVASMAIERAGVEGTPERAEVEAYLAKNP